MSDWRRRLRTRNDLQWIVLVVVVLALVNIGHVVGNMPWSDVQSVITSVAIVVGAAFAVFKLQIFRAFEPHLTITQEVSHRSVGDSYVHIVVTARLHNSSKVRVDLRRGFFRLQQIQPIPDEEVERLYSQVFVDRAETHLQWTILDEAPREWAKNEASVEPGESHQATCEFIVSSDLKSVLIYTYIYNARASQDPSAADGWAATTVHDILGQVDEAVVS